MMTQRVEKGIEDNWNGKTYECCDVVFDAIVVHGDEYWMSDIKRWWTEDIMGEYIHDNQILITNDGSHRSYVNGETYPHTQNTGMWYGGEEPWVYAHETGHLMGLPDQYTDTPYGYSKANPGYEGTMMGEYGGTVSQGEIDDIMSMYGIECPSECKK
jgi:hypothetical protein